MRKLIFILVFCGTALGMKSQDIKFTATAPQVVGLDQRFEVNFTVNTTNVSNFQAPTFIGVQILSGPNQSQSTSLSLINGRRQGGSSVTFSYWLQPINVGSINIAPAKIKVGGTTYTSNSLSIRVEKNATSSQGKQNPRSPQVQNQQQPQITLDNKTLFLRAIPNKTSAVPGEQIVLTYKLYTLVSISQYQIERSPVSKGFWLEETDVQQQTQITRETFEGRQYNVATIRKVLVFPQEEGDLTIEPLSIEVTAHVQARRNRKGTTGDSFFDAFFNDPFFSSMFDIQDQPIQKKLSSNSVKIKVKSLANTPPNYIGAVGDFSLSSSIDRTECKANEAITLKYTISGTGNLTLIDKLPIKLPSDFEIYEPTLTDEIQKTENGISGKRTFEYIVIPRQEGKFILDSLAVSFYDTDTKQFKVLTSPQYNLTIDKGKESEFISEQRNEREKYRKMDIMPLKTPKILENITKTPYKNPWFWLIVIIILTFFAVAILLKRQKIEQNKDIMMVRLRKANRIAIKRLKRASILLQKHENEAFITEISQALWNYMENKFSIERFNLSKERISATMTQFSIEQTLTNDIISLLEHCEMLRFSTEKSFEQNESLYDRALTAISELEIQLKSKNKKKNPMKKPLTLLFLSTFLLLSFSSWAKTPENLMKEAENLYKSQKYEKALAIYLTLEPQFADSWQLNYNIGNTYFRLADFPSAILFFERAIKLNPHEKDLQKNLKIANSRLKEEAVFMPDFILWRWIQDFCSFFTPKMWANLSLLLLFVSGIAFFFYFFTQNRKVLTFYLFIFALLFTCLSFSAGLVRTGQLKNENYAIIFDANGIIQDKKTDISYGKEKKIKFFNGEKVKVVEKTENFFIIETPAGIKTKITPNSLQII